MFSINARKMDATHIYWLMSGGSSLFFTLVFTVNLVYQVQTLALSPLQLVLVGTTLEACIFLFEIPTGIVADVYSRRLSIIIGFVLTGIGFIIEGSLPIFGAVLLSQVLWGIGYTFTSGATEAWMTDEIGSEYVGSIFMRASRIGNLVSIVGTIIAILLGSLFINLPIILGGVLFLALALFLILYMPETGFHPTPAEDRSTWRHMLHTLRSSIQQVRGRPVLLAILGIGLFLGLYSEGFDRLSTDHMLKSFVLPDFGGLQPVAWMGIIGIIGNFLSALATRFVERRLDMKDGRAMPRALFIISTLLLASIMGFALAGSFVMVVLMRWAVSILRTLHDPIETTWINQNVESNVRATVISIRGQVDAIGQVIGGPPVGLIGDTFGVRAALVASGLILSPVLYLYARVLRRSKEVVPVVALAE